ncbi:FAD-binding oxidoreductase [Azospirillum sp. YIM B02556]|uniref:FAD-binding oxidoreductase n=1 Tax=Azospirillum endophyticum TaxID=2800326 RepID=A0ABS1FHM4_9PROT|nr:FAD-binding oxidoreductase [Azospirillum endophyticum]MBK1842946.1 FAD-binding oxidoreductase [Azospirillum endophyticum]
MGLIVEDVTADADVPAETAVVVIGGGIVGTSTALFLARKGVPVVLCEKGHIAGEQSSRNWGWIITCGRDDREIPISILSARLWRGMPELVEADIGYRATGIARLYDSDAPIAVAEAWIRRAAPQGLDARMLSGAEVATLFPGATRPFKGGLFASGDAVAEPQRAAPAIARAAQRGGAVILTNCAVRALDTEAGRVSGVWTERGRIKADAVVLAGGAWSRLFCDSLDVRLSQLLVQASVMRTAPLAGGPLPAAVTQHYSFRRRADGGYTIGDPFNTLAPITPSSFRFLRDFTPMLRMSWRRLRPTAGRFMTELRDARRQPPEAASAYERTRVNDPGPDQRFIDEARRRLVERFPIFGTVAVEQSWAGLLDVTPDAIPVISSVPAIPGFHIGTGFSGHGFTLGPGAGHVLADLATGSRPAVDVTPFSITRFSDGSRPDPQVGF